MRNLLICFIMLSSSAFAETYYKVVATSFKVQDKEWTEWKYEQTLMIVDDNSIIIGLGKKYNITSTSDVYEVNGGSELKGEATDQDNNSCVIRHYVKDNEYLYIDYSNITICYVIEKAWWWFI